MGEEELKKFLKENLEIRASNTWNECGKVIKIELVLCNEIISDDYAYMQD